MKTPETLSDLTPDFWLMLITDFIAERTPRTRSCDMVECRRIAVSFVDAHPDAVPEAIESVNDQFHLERAFIVLGPRILQWARKTIPDLLERPAGMY